MSDSGADFAACDTHGTTIRQAAVYSDHGAVRKSGILVAELDDSGTAFYSHWDIWDPAWKTPEFSVELDANDWKCSDQTSDMALC